MNKSVLFFVYLLTSWERSSGGDNWECAENRLARVDRTIADRPNRRAERWTRDWTAWRGTWRDRRPCRVEIASWANEWSWRARHSRTRRARDDWLTDCGTSTRQCRARHSRKVSSHCCCYHYPVVVVVWGRFVGFEATIRRGSCATRGCRARADVAEPSSRRCCSYSMTTRKRRTRTTRASEFERPDWPRCDRVCRFARTNVSSRSTAPSRTFPFAKINTNNYESFRNL